MKRNEIISDKQAIALLVFIMTADKIVMAVATQAKKDFWLSIILAVAICIPILLIFARLHVLFPKKNFFDMIESIGGKYLGKVLILLFVFYTSMNTVLVTDIFSYFVTTASITGSPKVIPAIAIMLLCAWVVKEGIEVMGRFASLFLILFVCIIAIGVIFMIPKMEINNLRPIFNEGIKPTIEGAIYTIGFPLSESVIFIMIFTPSKTGNSPNKIYINALLIAGLILFITSFSEFLVLGTDEYTKTYFPAYKAVSRINIGDFIQRMEIIPAAAYVIGGFVKLSICLLAITNGVSKLCNCGDYRLIVIPITLLMINGSLFVTSSMMHLFAWTEEIWTTFSLPFQVILPIMIWIAAEIKTKKIKAVNRSMQK